jgi:hypothetical protein
VLLLHVIASVCAGGRHPWATTIEAVEQSMLATTVVLNHPLSRLATASLIALGGCVDHPSSSTRQTPQPTPSTQITAGAPGPATIAPFDQPEVVTSPPPMAAGTTAPATGDADVCKASSVSAQKLAVDVFMMIDQSISMITPDDSGNSRWDDVIQALTQFVQAPDSAGIGIGVQYFGLGLAGGSCAPEDYASAEVAIAPLPANADPIVSSFAAHMPSSVTPTAPALQGAIQYAQTFKQTNPTHSVMVLLVTDGEPDACGLIDDTVSAAAAGLTASSPITTYVLGVGTELDALNQIAQAGGTEHAYIVDGTADVSGQVVAALNKIRGMALLPCEFQIPTADPGTKFDYDKVNLSFTPPMAASTIVGYAADLPTCNAAPMAWHYDDPNAPTKIELCDATCKTVTSTGGTIDIALHCPTVPVVLQ